MKLSDDDQIAVYLYEIFNDFKHMLFFFQINNTEGGFHIKVSEIIDVR